MTKMKGLLGAAAIGALAVGFGSSPAAALSIQDYMFNNTLWNDESAESIAVDNNSNGLLDVGDTLRGILHINQANNQTPPGGSIIPATQNNEITAIFEAQVATKTLTGANALGPLYTFTFVPVGGVNGTGFVAPGVVGQAGAMVAMYFDSDENTNKFELNGPTCTSTAPGGNCEQNASDDSLVLVLGQGSDVDFQWFAQNASDNPSNAEKINTATPIGDFHAFLSVLTNNTGKAFSPIGEGLFDNPLDGGDGKIDIVASGTLRGSCAVSDTFPAPCPTPATPYQAEDKTDFTFNTIPEPATLTFLGASLLGMGIASRRRRK
jgi:hypothetical protein